MRSSEVNIEFISQLHIISLLTEDMNSILTLLLMRGFIAQLVVHCIGICGGQGLNSPWSPDFFQTASFQLLKLENLPQWSFFTFIYNRSSNSCMNYFIYTSHTFTPHGRYELNIDLPPNVWLHSSVDRALHQYSWRWWVQILLKPWFFSGFFFSIA